MISSSRTIRWLLAFGLALGLAATAAAQTPLAPEPDTPEQPSEMSVERPQDPVPPFPYVEEEVTVQSGQVTLAGTLTLPAGDDPVPALVLVSGSGANDRNQEILGHRTFLVLADHLTRAGYAVLRLDDRGVGGSSGEYASMSYDDLAGDVGAALDLLATHPRVDAGSIGILGHSQGGYLAPIVAGARDDVAFVVLMAGPAVDGFSTLLVQNERVIAEVMRAQDPSQSEEAIDAAVADQHAFLEALFEPLESGDLEAARTVVRERVESQVAAQSAALPEDEQPSEEEISALIAQQEETLTSQSFASFLTFDPRPHLERLDVPTLALFGERDVQVDAEQSEGPMRDALAAAGNDDATVITFPGINHLMQPADTGSVEEYADIETTIDPEVLDAITDWLRDRFPPS